VHAHPKTTRGGRGGEVGAGGAEDAAQDTGTFKKRQRRRWGEEAAMAFARCDGSLQLIAKCADLYPTRIQGLSLRIMSGVCRIARIGVSMRAAETLLDLGSMKFAMEVLHSYNKDGKMPSDGSSGDGDDGGGSGGSGGGESLSDAAKRSRDQEEAASAALSFMLHACQASERFNSEACQAGLIALLERAQTSGRPFPSVAEGLIASLKEGPDWLIHLLTTGGIVSQERAAVAIWHMSAHQPIMRARLNASRHSQNSIESVAFTGVENSKALEAVWTTESSHVQVRRYHTDAARRGAINALKALGQLPSEFEPLDLKKGDERKKRLKRTKLGKWREYLAHAGVGVDTD